MAAALEPFERKAARERQGTRTDKHPEKISEGSSGRCEDKISAAVGMSRVTPMGVKKNPAP